MTTRIGTGGPGTGVTATASAARVTAAPGQPFKAMMSAGKNAILSGAESAVTRLPGGPILAAALRPSAGDVGPAQTGAGGAAALGGVGSSTPEGAAGTAGIGGGQGGGTAASGTENGGVEAALNQSANQNLYFIEIQERISAESRSYSAISNVLKARHDTVKNAIGNIR
ncbi:MAG TPA: hypothetical protein VHP33_09520 [Polyangiaceae bacterium]|nr:hypothetical protein [Polyangiaceae bacterium]